MSYRIAGNAKTDCLLEKELSYLVEATGEFHSRQSFLKYILKNIQPDHKQYLSVEGLEWYQEAAKAFDRGEVLPDFADYDFRHLDVETPKKRRRFQHRQKDSAAHLIRRYMFDDPYLTTEALCELLGKHKVVASDGYVKMVRSLTLACLLHLKEEGFLNKKGINL